MKADSFWVLDPVDRAAKENYPIRGLGWKQQKASWLMKTFPGSAGRSARVRISTGLGRIVHTELLDLLQEARPFSENGVNMAILLNS